MAIKVLIAEPSEIVRAGLRLLLESEGEVEVTAEVGDGREAVAIASRKLPDVVLAELDLPYLNGRGATSELARLNPPIPVVVLTTRHDRTTVLSLLDAGASGYVLKSSTVADLHRALRAAHEGKTFLSPTVAELVVDSYQQQIYTETENADDALLGERERQVLQLIAEGHTSAEIASELHLATSTVNTHRRNIMRKLDIHSIAGLTKYAVRENLSSLDIALN